MLSRLQIRCYWVDTFPDLAVLPKMVSKSQRWKSQSCPIWMVQLLPDMKFWGESEYQGPMSWFLLCIPLYPKWCGRHQDGIKWPLLIGLVQIASRLFFKEILNLKREIVIYQKIINYLIISIIVKNTLLISRTIYGNSHTTIRCQLPHIYQPSWQSGYAARKNVIT